MNDKTSNPNIKELKHLMQQTWAYNIKMLSSIGVDVIIDIVIGVNGPLHLSHPFCTSVVSRSPACDYDHSACLRP